MLSTPGSKYQSRHTVQDHSVSSVTREALGSQRSNLDLEVSFLSEGLVLTE